ncbi:MAG: hypothetical protein RLZZ502_1068, partial [Pseudomonadota bacterium]
MSELMGVQARIPLAFAKAHGILPVRDEGLAVHVLTAPEVSLDALAEVRRLIGKALRIEAVGKDRFSEMLAVLYEGNSTLGKSSTIAASTDTGTNTGSVGNSEDKITEQSDAPTVERVNQLLLQALAARASDIHLEPSEAGANVRYRVDGVLFAAGQLNPAETLAVTARLKVMASLDLAERRLPQDGRMRLRLAERAVDVRISTLPSLAGERVVLRLLDTAQAALQLDALGFAAPLLEEVHKLLSLSNGLVLVTGP